MTTLQIYDRRERAIVGTADALLRAATAAVRPFRRRTRPAEARRILLLRLERIGDLVMALPAIRDVRALAPDARIDLAVGSWNASIARALPYVDRVITLDAAWLARGAAAQRPASMLAAVKSWRSERYDLAINFEPDIRSNLLMALAGARWTAGWRSGGGGPLLDSAFDFDQGSHTAANARRLVADVFGRAPLVPAQPLIALPDEARRAAMSRLKGRAAGPVIGLHVSGGRLVKQWDPARFRQVAEWLTVRNDATLVLTGSRDDRPMVDVLKSSLRPDRVVDVAGDIDLIDLAALIGIVDVFLTGDTGPMHIAAAVGTPIVAVFGPSNPARYAPSGPYDRIVRIDLPCSPCNQIRLPPERCRGIIPDCLTGIPPERVYEAVLASLDDSRRHGRPRANPATA